MNNKEVWKDIIGYEGYYQISNFGNVRSVDRIVVHSNGKTYQYKGKIIKQHIDSTGRYWIVTLNNNNLKPRKKTFLTHILVAKTFIPNPNNYPMVMHKDEKNLKYDRECNNNVNNLQWGTCADNKSQDVARKRMSEFGKNKSISDEQKVKLSKSLIGKKHPRRPVVCDGILFNTIMECADYCGEDKQAIASWLRRDSVPKFLKDRGLRYA